MRVSVLFSNWHLPGISKWVKIWCKFHFVRGVFCTGFIRSASPPCKRHYHLGGGFQFAIWRRVPNKVFILLYRLNLFNGIPQEHKKSAFRPHQNLHFWDYEFQWVGDVLELNCVIFSKWYLFSICSCLGTWWQQVWYKRRTFFFLHGPEGSSDLHFSPVKATTGRTHANKVQGCPYGFLTVFQKIILYPKQQWPLRIKPTTKTLGVLKNGAREEMGCTSVLTAVQRRFLLALLR